MPFRPVADALANAASYQAKDMWKPSGNYNYAGSPALAAGNAMKPTVPAPAKPVTGGPVNGPPLTPLQDITQKAMSYTSPSFPVSGDATRAAISQISRGQTRAQQLGLLPSTFKQNPQKIAMAAQQRAYRQSLRNK
jgi:hypothetical protein